ncbi:MAG TPA: hypothetical protein DCE41_34550 [Cytophagales bacterium]|nr:hypothetical protein [Cytophagales bacterium]HAP63523.1 hypothetical protein [Cytophagales bacterium]
MKNMKRALLLSALLLPWVSYSQDAAPAAEVLDEQEEEYKFIPVNVGILPPLSVNSLVGGRTENIISMDAFMGMTHRITGLQTSGFMGMVRGQVNGAQTAGFLTIAQEVNGAQISGFGAITGPVYGGQGAGFFNVAGPVTGAQGAGFANVADEVSGGQVAGFMNIASGKAAGPTFQGAGFMNIGGDVTVQAAGFLNIAKKVNGIQVGVVNVADSADYQLGILNFTKSGGRYITLYASDMFLTNVGFKSGGNKMYTHLGFGAASLVNNRSWGTHFGVGFHVTDKIDVELANTNLIAPDFTDQGADFVVQLKPSYNLPLFSDRIALTITPSLNYLYSGFSDTVPQPLYWLWEQRNPDQEQYQFLWVGGNLGVQVRI